jgi:hypothetical protein
MSCVPLDANPFELGPRDYLHRFLTLISTLRGGQSRYLPLLMSKISEVLPSAQLGIPGNFSQAPRPPGSDIYDSSTVTGSAPGSHEATPFDSPPHLSIPLRPAHSYSDLKQGSLQPPTPTHTQIPPNSLQPQTYAYTSSSMPYPDPVTMSAVGSVTPVQSSGIVLHDIYSMPRQHGQEQGYGE